MGMGTVYTECFACGRKGFVGRNVWNTGKAKCKACGGGLCEVDKPKRPRREPQPKQRTRSPEEQAEYRMTEEYRHEVTHVEMPSENEDL